MAELEPEQVRSFPPPPDPFVFSSGTYIIQIPKDQVFRIPPPENALIVQRHRNPSTTSSPRYSCCLRFCLPIFIILLLVILIAIFLPPLLSRPKSPVIKLTKFIFAPSGPDFSINLNILNPNSAGSMTYKSPSHAFLTFRKHELAAGKFPMISQNHGSKRNVALKLHAKSSSSFPKEFQRRLKNDKSKLGVAMILKMNLDVESRGRLSLRPDVKFDVECSFTVNTLGKNSKILSHHCESKTQ